MPELSATGIIKDRPYSPRWSLEVSRIPVTKFGSSVTKDAVDLKVGRLAVQSSLRFGRQVDVCGCSGSVHFDGDEAEVEERRSCLKIWSPHSTRISEALFRRMVWANTERRKRSKTIYFVRFVGDFRSPGGAGGKRCLYSGRAGSNHRSCSLSSAS